MIRHELHLDYETYCDLLLDDVGVYRYVEHPSFEILMGAWRLDDGPVHLAIGEDAVREIPGLWDSTVVKVAFNANFERICTSALAGMETGEYLPVEEWHDPMAVAGCYGYPMKLEHTAKWLGGEQKDAEGRALIRYFCMPNKWGKRNYPSAAPEKWQRFGEYCVQDVVTETSIDAQLGDFPTETERQVWQAHERINDLGIRVDLELARNAMAAAEENRPLQVARITELTGVENPNSVAQLLKWLRTEALLDIPSLRAEVVSELLEGELDEDVREVLELRAELALSAFNKFASASASASSDHRLRGRFFYFGAHTGRWAGRGVQPHNLPRASFTTEDPETGKQVFDEAGQTAAILDLAMGLGADALTLKKLVRALFLGPLTIVDYAAIEARVLAWLAGEEWALQAFRDRRDIYVETAERMGGLTRSQGKVAVLALGFNGGVGSLRKMGAEGSDALLQNMVSGWRQANGNIVQFWKDMNEAWRTGGPVGEHVRVEVDGNDRLVWLPSGRPIVYHDIHHKWVDKVWPSGDKSRMLQGSYLDPKKAYIKGARVDTYGGKLTENVTQAVARDLLAEALIRLQGSGHRVVAHVHDEILVEGEHPVEEIASIMCETPTWADGLPVSGEGFVTERYRKG